MPSFPTSASPLSRMLSAIRVKSPFSHNALFAFVVAVICLLLCSGIWLDGQERHALDPVFGAGVTGPIGDELVGVLEDRLDPQPRPLDRLAVGGTPSRAARP